MANKSLFQTLAGKLAPRTDTRNEAGAVAYQLSPQAALAQYAVTGCLNTTFYASAQDQLQQVLKLTSGVPTDFIARTAVYCRERGYMKDMPALLCAVLAQRDAERLELIFHRVIDDAKMLRNFVQILRSGVTGRKSLGTLPKRLVRKWLEARSDEALFRADVGQSPSLKDIICMVHPKPRDASREALYGYITGRPHRVEVLPELVQQFEAWKETREGNPPDVPFQMLTSLTLKPEHWQAIARRASWQMTRMNLNTFARHGVFENAGLTRQIAARLSDPEKVKQARVFPYQLLMAYSTAGTNVPLEVREALQDAMEVAVSNVPKISGKVYVCPDVSGSMHSPLTGVRPGSTSAVTCLHAAALMAAAVLRQNPASEVMPFTNDVVTLHLNPRDSVMTNAQKMINLPPGGTNCSAPLVELNRRKAKGDLVIFVSDNESWIDTPVHGRFGGSPTRTMEEWNKFKSRNPQARLVCLDIQPYASTQAQERADIMNIGGFSDQVFNVIASYAQGESRAGHFVREINQTQL